MQVQCISRAAHLFSSVSSAAHTLSHLDSSRQTSYRNITGLMLSLTGCPCTGAYLDLVIETLVKQANAEAQVFTVLLFLAEQLSLTAVGEG